MEVPFGIDRPYWIEDPDFDLEYHLRHLAIPAPGDDEQLAAQVARIIGRPCDRSRPLSEVYVIEGLATGDFTVLTKMHHATVDGAAGAMLTTMLLDDSPDAPLTAPGDLPKPDRVPTDGVRQPDRALRIQLRMAHQFAKAARAEGASQLLGSARRVFTGSRRPSRTDGDSAPEAPSTSAPRTSLNTMISPHRRVAFRSVSLARVKEVKNAAGATLNDVDMAACAGGLRTYLDDRDELPTQPLVGMIPVSIRTGDEHDPWTNRVSALFRQLPTHLHDPLERMRFVHDAMVEAKSDWDLLPADTMVNLAQMAPPALAERAARFRVAERANPPMNLTISNVPGPESRSTCAARG